MLRGLKVLAGTTYYQPPEPSQEAGRVGYFVFDFGTVKYL